MALVVLFAASGCRGTVREEGTGSPLEQAAKAYAAAECEKELECMPFYAKAAFGEQPECEAAIGPFLVYLLTFPEMVSSPDDILHCAEGLKAASCSAFLNGTITGCDIAGTRADGGACGGPGQCESGYCYNPYAGGCGVCETPKAIGEACTGDFQFGDCAPGAFCGSAHKCVPTPLNVGDPCPEYYCGELLRCDSGVCAALQGVGAECHLDSDCDWPNGLSCDFTTSTCVQGHLAAPGESCAAEHTRCIASGICDATSKKCVARSKTGEACPGENTCQVDNDCVNGTCQAIPFATCE